MKTLFFYGTLRHVPLVECVLGRDSGTIDFAAASLSDYVARSAPDGLYPVLRKHAGAKTPGIVVRDLSVNDIARLNYYEGGFDYELHAVTLTSGEAAQVYLPGETVSHIEDLWDFGGWLDRWEAMTVWAAMEVMDGFGKLSTAEIARRFPRIRARAWSKVLAQSGRHGHGVLDGRVDLVSRKRAHTNFFCDG